MIKWIKQNKIEVLLILIIIFVSAFLRFYRLPEYMTFLGDEGRDALIIKQILVEHNLPFIGPPTSVGNIYLGPLYYYLMATVMAVFWLNPIAAAGMVGAFGVATVLLIYYLARRWFGVVAAVLSSSLYALSFVTIIYSRSSWNPNPAPFFALLSVLGFELSHRSRDFRWLILTGTAVSAAVQMHYLALILIPFLGLLWIYEVSLKSKGEDAKHLILGTFGAVIAFLTVILPLALFDFRHDFLNSRAIITLSSGKEGAVSFNVFENITRTIFLYKDSLIGRYVGAENSTLTLVISLLIFIPLVMAIRSKIKGKKIEWPFIVLGLWLLVGIFGLYLYKQNIYDHYLGFLNPVPFLLLAGLISLIRKKWQLLVAIMFIVILGILNLQRNPLLFPPNNQLERTQKVAQFVIRESSGKPFNFALIAKNNYDSAYQYYLDFYGHKPKVVPVEITEQLFVVCEDAICNPIGHAKYEIAGFGWAQIDRQYEVEGLKIYKLVENPEGRKFKTGY